MKKLITLFIILAFGVVSAQHHFPGHLNPSKLDSVQLTGKAIVKSVENRTKYFLDTNSDGTADYHLDFGPSWYVPIDSLAARPKNGDDVTIIGGKFSDTKDSLAIVIVYQINGHVWRNPFIADWNDLGHRDSLSGFLHDKKPGHGYGFKPKHDSLLTKILTGTVLVDTTFKMDRYFLDTDADGTPNYILNFGPYWYQPASGAVRPQNGENVTIRAGILGANSKYPMAIVYEINGLVWRDSTTVHASVGGKYLSANGSTVISSLFDSGDTIQIQQGHSGMHATSDFAVQFFESYPENMPSYKGMNIFAGYEISIFDNAGMNYMLVNGRSGGQMELTGKTTFQFHYTDEQLSDYNVSENNIKVKVWNEILKTWQNVNASVNTSTNSITFTSNTIGNYYTLTGSTITGVSQTTESIPTGYVLEQNYPNPFNPTTNISYSLPVAGNVSLRVFDILGNEIAELVNGFKDAGNYNIQFNGKNLVSGVYFYRLNSGDFTSVKKLILVK